MHVVSYYTVELFPFGELFQDTPATDTDEITITTSIVLFERNETSLYVSCMLLENKVG